jgi:hypothetical protein
MCTKPDGFEQGMDHATKVLQNARYLECVENLMDEEAKATSRVVAGNGIISALLGGNKSPLEQLTDAPNQSNEEVQELRRNIAAGQKQLLDKQRESSISRRFWQSPRGTRNAYLIF